MNIILSPHTDDAIFSLGEMLAFTKNVVIVSPFAGIPTDEEGFEKHTTLRTEHKRACMFIHCSAVNGSFLDDVYGLQDINELKRFVSEYVNVKGSTTYIPFGIHHPDHILLSDIAMELWDKKSKIRFHEELPYRVLYPEKYSQRFNKIEDLARNIRAVEGKTTELKEHLVKFYKSQIDEALIPMLTATERLWEVL